MVPRLGRTLMQRARSALSVPWERLKSSPHRSGFGWSFAVTMIAVALMLGSTAGVLWPMLRDFGTYGFHDWDISTAFRYITVVSLKEYGEGPWWHPWLCGGYPGFGHHEGASNFISPYLPLYLLADIRTAIRLEVVGGALVGLVGTYVLAGRFTRSVGLRTFLAIAYVLNGRWALQAATGHTWHLQYGWLPWTLWFFDRAQEPERLGRAVWAGAVIAIMVYACGIYPVPQTALVLTGYAVLLAIFTRRTRPLLALGTVAVTAVGFSAPKLLAVLDSLQRTPRLIESTETIGLAELLVMMLDSAQSYATAPIRTPAYGWHEWGIYVGPAVAFALAVGLLFAHGRRENALKVLGVLLLLLGFGKFHEHAPWALLHQLPVFSSQHVPSRFHYPMVLVLGLCFVSWAAGFVDRRVGARPWLDLLPLALATWVAVDIARVSQRSISQAFWMEAPDTIPKAELFEHRKGPVVHYKRRDWAPPVLLSMFANTGMVKCYGLAPDFDGVGAIGLDDPRYRGRAYIAEGSGDTEVVQWTPNRAVVRVKNASDGALLVYNMNWDPSWRANDQPAISYDKAVATRVSTGTETVEFRYFPRTLKLSLPICFGTMIAVFAAFWVTRRRSSLELGSLARVRSRSDGVASLATRPSGEAGDGRSPVDAADATRRLFLEDGADSTHRRE